MGKFLKSRTGAAIICLVIALIGFSVGAKRSVSELYKEVAQTKCNAANNLLSIADHYSNVDASSLRTSRRALLLLIDGNSTISDYRKTIAAMDGQFIDTYVALSSERLTTKDKEGIETDRSDYREGSQKITPFVENVLVKIII
ncbi:MAG: hypothetical protein LBN43_10030 [Oscillospiraceae bacterium]|jgi:hypothetical protein|nr:hypothetical protein [Oscillospiraceae bacterium]